MIVAPFQGYSDGGVVDLGLCSRCSLQPRLSHMGLSAPPTKSKSNQIQPNQSNQDPWKSSGSVGALLKFDRSFCGAIILPIDWRREAGGIYRSGCRKLSARYSRFMTRP